MTAVPSTLCPVCGYDVGVVPWMGDSASDEICRSCGVQFGYDDAIAKGDRMHPFYAEWRSRWLADGALWWSRSQPPPGWDGNEQVRRYLGK